jgi:hypothetical protein
MHVTHKNITDETTILSIHFNCSLTPDQLKGTSVVPLSQAKFSTTRNIHIFIPGNQADEETTEITSISLFGVPLKTSLGVAGYNITLK